MAKYVFEGLQPERLLHFFYEISQIPRGSENEAGIADYLVAFSSERGLNSYRDSKNNVLIKKKATPGYEDRKTVVLQGHTDMVCEKNPEILHDFEYDPLCLRYDGTFIYADGTTLGGDDGVAVAIMLAILDDKDLPHPDLECLFTACEEVGLDGMSSFDPSKLNGRTMINIDSTGEGEAVVSCAGGCRSDFYFDLKYEPDDRTAFRIAVSGFSGGHSGENINEGRMNANKAMARLLDAVAVEAKFRLVSIDGGSKDNAIPRESFATFTSNKPECVYDWVKAEWNLIMQDCKDFDKVATMTFEELGPAKESISFDQSADILRSILVLPSGVIEMNPLMANVPETSSNLGSIYTQGKKMVVTSLTRSSVDSKLDNVLHVFDAVAAFASAKVVHRNRYPGWSFKEGTKLQKAYLETYKKLTGNEAKLISIHAGLECGLMSEKIPDMDMISIGPDLYDIHSPKERLNLASFARTYQLVCELLKNL